MAIPYWGAKAYIPGGGLERRLYAVTPDELEKNKHFPDISSSELFDKAYLPAFLLKLAGVDVPSNGLPGQISGGRATTLDDVFTIDNQEFRVNIKGSSSRGHVNPDGFFVSSFWDTEINPQYKALIEQLLGEERYADIIADDVHAEKPYGGQSLPWALDALELSTSMRPESLDMLICPTISVPTLSKKFMIHNLFYKSRGGHYIDELGQELRLLPSNVRLQGDEGISRLTPRHITHLKSKELEEFVHNLITSLLQIATLSVRTCKKVNDLVYTGMVLDDSCVDRDCAIAADGRTYYTDLESIETKTYPAHYFREQARFQIRKGLNALSLALGYSPHDFLAEKLDTINDAIPKHLTVELSGAFADGYRTAITLNE
jgi:hypothetical protein